MIRYADILAESLVDGSGLRVSAFLQGCIRHCQSCHNEKLIAMNGGNLVSEREFADLIIEKLTPLHRGVTFSGGEPLIQADALFAVIAMVREKIPKIDIWVYTGYTYEEVSQLEVMSLIDVLVDGPFVLTQKNLFLAFRGSSNQRIIDIKETRETGKIVQLYLDKESTTI
jgi:anaerobic ribonucleoside-triphosphate reductase activating protein